MGPHGVMQPARNTQRWAAVEITGNWTGRRNTDILGSESVSLTAKSIDSMMRARDCARSPRMPVLECGRLVRVGSSITRELLGDSAWRKVRCLSVPKISLMAGVCSCEDRLPTFQSQPSQVHSSLCWRGWVSLLKRGTVSRRWTMCSVGLKSKKLVALLVFGRVRLRLWRLEVAIGTKWCPL